MEVVKPLPMIVIRAQHSILFRGCERLDGATGGIVSGRDENTGERNITMVVTIVAPGLMLPQQVTTS